MKYEIRSMKLLNPYLRNLYLNITIYVLFFIIYWVIDLFYPTSSWVPNKGMIYLIVGLPLVLLTMFIIGFVKILKHEKNEFIITLSTSVLTFFLLLISLNS